MHILTLQIFFEVHISKIITDEQVHETFMKQRIIGKHQSVHPPHNLLVYINWENVSQTLYTTVSTKRNMHSVSRETHRKFIGFTCDPGSRSSNPGWIIFDHQNYPEHRQNKIHNKVDLTTLFPKRNTTFLLKVSVHLRLSQVLKDQG